MRRIWLASASVVILGTLFLGCGKNQDKKEEEKPVAVNPDIQVLPPNLAKKVDDKNDPGKFLKIIDPTDPACQLVKLDAGKQAQYEAAVADALAAVAERKWDEALLAFETARGFQDNAFVQSEISELKKRIDREGSAKTTIHNIETILGAGNADEAIKLVSLALIEFGDGPDADKLIQLRLQAEALKGVKTKESPDARFHSFRKEGEEALAEKKLRAAALAFEQALLARDDAELQKTYDKVRDQLDRYDALRKQGYELRQDATRIEDAIEALKGAKAVWDTPQIRQDLDDAMLAIQARRDNVSVADFEVRNDVGMPGAGAAVADELLPLLKKKFDIVDRNQLQQIIAGLKLEKGFNDDAEVQKQIGKLAKVRYLVVGSVHRFAAVSVRARLVDVQSGLVVQTAKVLAPNMEQALALAPELARQLMMTDQEKMQADQLLVQNPQNQPVVVAEKAVIPAAPMMPDKNDPAPPPIKADLAAPGLANLKADLFAKFAGSAPGSPFAVQPLEAKFRHRLLHAAVEMGDYLFESGRFAEAQRQYSFALSLAPNHFEILLRLERTRPLVPPVPFLMLGQPQPIFALPRIVVMPFATAGNALFVPPALAYWTPSNLAPYFSSRYEVADPNLIYWYMARTGLSMRDLVENPIVLRWLGRASGVRYFVFGNHLQTFNGTIDVSTYLIDAESGWPTGSARINVQTTYELKLRLPELAQLTMMTPAEKGAIVAQQQQFQSLLAQGLGNMQTRAYDRAKDDFQAALSMRPDSVQAQFYYCECVRLAYVYRFEIQRRKDAEAQQALLAAADLRRSQLVLSSDQMQQIAVADAANASDADRQANVQFLFQAQAALIDQGQQALKTNQFGLSVNYFQGATNVPLPANASPPASVRFPPPKVLFAEFAKARFEADKTAAVRDAKWTETFRNKLLQTQLQQNLDAQKIVLADQRKMKKSLDAISKSRQESDEKAYLEGFKQGQKFFEQKKYDAALAAYQTAQSVKQTEKVNQMIELVAQRQAEALAKSDAERKAIETKYLEEKRLRKNAEAQAEQKTKLYQEALQSARKALAGKDYDTAQSKFQEAGQVFKTDAVLAGLKQAESGRAGLVKDSEKTALERKKADTIKQLLADGNGALNAKDYAAAAQSFRQAKKLAPDDLTILAGLTQAELALSTQQAAALRKAGEKDREANFRRYFKSGQENLANKNYNAAVANLNAALKLNPSDASVKAALKQAEKARDASVTDAKGQTDAKLAAEAYRKKMSDGWLALSGKRYDDAIKHYGEAQKLLPGDKASREFLDEAQSSKKAAEEKTLAAAKKRADDAKNAEALQQALTKGRAALLAKDFDAASKLLAQAQQLGPNNSGVQKALLDLQRAQKQTGTIDQKTGASNDQKQAEHQLQLSAGQKAMQSKNYEDAIKSFQAALNLIPNDALAGKLLVQAQQALSVQTKTQAGFQKALGAGQTAMTNKKYSAAVASFKEALKLLPNDANAQQLLDQALQAQQGSDLQANYLKTMTAGQNALTAKRYDLAVKSFNDALKLAPNDQKAQLMLQQAQRGYEDAKLLAAEHAQKQMQYKELMSAGQTAMFNKKYDDAMKSYADALKLMPKDFPAQRAWQDAKKALDSSKTKTAPMPGTDPPKSFDQTMQKAAGLEKEQKYADAASAYHEALKFRPKDAGAQAGWNRSQFAANVAQGQQYLESMMFLDAQREFEAALRISPNNPNVLKLLQKSKNKGK